MNLPSTNFVLSRRYVQTFVADCAVIFEGICRGCWGRKWHGINQPASVSSTNFEGRARAALLHSKGFPFRDVGPILARDPFRDREKRT